MGRLASFYFKGADAVFSSLLRSSDKPKEIKKGRNAIQWNGREGKYKLR